MIEFLALLLANFPAIAWRLLQEPLILGMVAVQGVAVCSFTVWRK